MLNNKKECNLLGMYRQIATFHSSIVSERGFTVGSNGQSKRRDSNNKGKKHIGQGVREIHGVW
jgi:hypothetical protein